MNKTLEKKIRCPHCEGQLQMDSKIILVVEKYSTWKRGLAFLDPTPGNYAVMTHESFPLVEGEKLMIFCPLCNRDLKSKNHVGLCHLLFDDGILYFAPDKGKHATFIEDGNKKISVFGVDASQYYDLFPGIENIKREAIDIVKNDKNFYA